MYVVMELFINVDVGFICSEKFKFFKVLCFIVELEVGKYVIWG